MPFWLKQFFAKGRVVSLPFNLPLLLHCSAAASTMAAKAMSIPAVGSVILATLVPRDTAERGQICFVVQKKLKPRRVMDVFLAGVREKEDELGKAVGATMGVYFCSSAEDVTMLSAEKELEFVPVESWRILGAGADFDLDFIQWMRAEEIDKLSDVAFAAAKRIKVYVCSTPRIFYHLFLVQPK